MKLTWTPTLVEARLVEGFDVLRRTSIRIGPRQPGNNFIQTVDFLEIDSSLIKLARVDIDAHYALQEARAEMAALKEAREVQQREAADIQAMKPVPTAEEVSRADEALGWCLKYLREYPLEADAIQLWAKCGAYDYSMARALRDRIEMADARARHIEGSFGSDDLDERRAEQRREEKHDQRIAKELRDRTVDVDPKVTRRQSEEFQRLKAEVVANAVNWANARLGIARDLEQADNIMANARIGLKRDLEHTAKKTRVSRQDVMPDKCFTRGAVNKFRKSGASRISRALEREGIEVR